MTHLDGFEQARLELQLELLFQHLLCLIRIIGVDTEADAVLRRGLSDQGDGNPGAGDGGEDAAGHADHSLHARATDVDHRDAGQIGDPLDRLFIIALFGDEGALALRVEAVLDETGDLKLSNGCNGAWVQHLGAKVGELHRLLIRHALEQDGIRDQTWVAAVDAVHIGPDLAAFGTDAGGQTGGGVVGAVAPQQHQFTLGIAAGEARHQIDGLFLKRFRLETSTGDIDVDVGFEEATLSQQQLYRVQLNDLMTANGEQLLHAGDGERLTATQDLSLHVVRTLPQEGDALHLAANRGKLLLHPCLEFGIIQRRVLGLQTVNQTGEDAFNLGQGPGRIQATTGLLHQGHQVVGHLGRSRQHQRHLGLLLGIHYDVRHPQEPVGISQ